MIQRTVRFLHAQAQSQVWEDGVSDRGNSLALKQSSDLQSFDLRNLPRSFYDDPYTVYRELRETSPVHRLPDGGIFLTRFADMERVYKDTDVFSSDKKVEFKPKFGETPLYVHHTTSLIFNDPPLHTRVRRLINGALTPRVIADLEGDLVKLVDSLLDAR